MLQNMHVIVALQFWARIFASREVLYCCAFSIHMAESSETAVAESIGQESSSTLYYSRSYGSVHIARKGTVLHFTMLRTWWRLNRDRNGLFRTHYV